MQRVFYAQANRIATVCQARLLRPPSFYLEVRLLKWMWSKMPTPSSVDRFLCLDMLRVSWVSAFGRATSECAILMEIWGSGVVLQTETEIPKDSILTLMTPNGPVCAKVTACGRDDYGFLIEVKVDSSERWFPNSYCPADLMPVRPLSRPLPRNVVRFGTRARPLLASRARN